MKRVDLLKKLNRKGCVFVRHGGNHDWYQNPDTKMCQPIPRHKEVNELVARSIIKKLS
ncbi:MAG: type II toxin-antitoxin system HicA family toxin [Kiritimatiellae bacterium]|jgi:mRNA interferase HicA|nr:type II toxin-antitoxin system HicA family toxin [Kiritimatiellia bacterium]